MSDRENGVGTFAIYGTYIATNLPLLEQYVKDSVDVLSYWNHIPLLYLIKTKRNAQHIAHKVAPFFANQPFIVMEINPLNLEGILPRPAWDWFLTPAPLYKTSTEEDTRRYALISALAKWPPNEPKT